MTFCKTHFCSFTQLLTFSTTSSLSRCNRSPFARASSRDTRRVWTWKLPSVMRQNKEIVIGLSEGQLRMKNFIIASRYKLQKSQATSTGKRDKFENGVFVFVLKTDKMFSVHQWNAASVPELLNACMVEHAHFTWGRTATEITWLLWHKRFQNVPFSPSTLTRQVCSIGSINGVLRKKFQTPWICKQWYFAIHCLLNFILFQTYKRTSSRQLWCCCREMTNSCLIFSF